MYINLITIDLCPGQGGGGVKPSGSLEISENGVYDVYSYASASVDVHPSASLSETYISNGNYNITGEFNGGVITVDVPAPQFVTETLNVSANGTYNPGEGIDGYSQVVVDVPQSVTGFTEKEITEGIKIVNLSNSASYVHPYVFEKDNYLQTVNLPNCTSVGENAFALCYNISSIYLPNVKTIGSSAFYCCSSLTTLDLPNVERIEYDAFAYCTGLTSITLNAKNVTGFNYCSNLQEVSLPNVETIGYSAFRYCSKISSIYFPNCITIQNSAFHYCHSLSYVDLPKLEYIYGYDVFGNCESLISVSMPNLIKISGYTTFEHCYGLSSLYFPKLRVIEGNWMFNDCKNLSIVDIPALIYNGSNLLERDPKLKELYINSETYVIPTYMLSDTTTGITSIYTNINNVSKFMVASGWSSHSDKIIGVGDPSIFMLSYSDGVVNGMTKGIGDGYYSYLGMSSDYARANVVSVDLPNCDYINRYTFYQHSNLTSVSLPNCEYIGDSAFYGCKSLTQINLSVCKYIGNLALYIYPTRSLSLTLGYSDVCKAGGQLFDGTNISNISVFVPASLVDAYKSADVWNWYSNRIFPIE